MKLNKKYEPQNKTRKPEKQQADFLFPVVFPSYQKISGKTAPQYLNQAIERNIRAQKLDKNIVPCFIRNVDSIGDSSILEGKEKLPFVAKLQRLSTHKEKIYKKSLPLFSQIFFQNHFDAIHKFLLSDEKNEVLLDRLQEKGVWKNKEELVYWDITTQSIVEPDAIERRKEKQIQLVVKCFVETKNDIFPLVVEDPMLLFSDVGIVIHSNDKRYKKHLWKKIIIPVINKAVPILGSTDIDTIKNNWIQRLNPLLDQKMLERVKELWLPTDENYIDDYWCFSKKVANFWWKSIFEFTDNVIETLGTIGNLASQEEVIKDIPYSKATWQRLIKKIVPMTIIDFSALQEEFSAWIENNFADHAEFLNFSTPEILLETKNPYAQKLSLLETPDGGFENFNLGSYSNFSIFGLLLLDQLRKEHISPSFTVDELIDLVLLLPEDEREDLENQIGEWKKIQELKENLRSKQSEELIEQILWELEKLKRIEANDETFKVDYKQLFWDKILHCIACSDTFLQAVSLIQTSTSQVVFHVDELASQTIKNFFFFLFILWWTECSIFTHEETDKIAIHFPERFQKLAENFGWETLKLALVQQEKCDEKRIEENFWYLKHLWNLFKVLYENWAYPENNKNEFMTDGKWMFILWRRNDIKTKRESTSFKAKEYAQHIKLLKDFTREEFARYLTLVKEEKENGSFLLAGQIYLDILDHLSVIIPEFVFMVKQHYWKEVKALDIDKFYSDTKDYKASIIFDIFKWIFHLKEELWLKKHMPIDFYIKANPNIIDLLHSYESSLKSLFHIKTIEYLRTNEDIPSWYKEFTILDMSLWVKPYVVWKKESTFDEREREMKAKQQTADYIRSMLMSLSLNPLTPAEKISEKQQELNDIMADIQHLEIKIQKAKMEKKA